MRESASAKRRRYNPATTNTLKGDNMKSKCVTLAVACSTLMSVIPAFAAPPEIEDFCWAQAAQIRFNGRGEREAFIANCIADFTPAPPAKRRYKKHRH